MKKFSVAFLLLCLSGTVTSQTFEDTFEKYSSNFISERIHFHFDKTSYAVGDTIWFKAYLMKGISPEVESKTLYVDWSDANGKLIKRTSWPILEGATFGQLAIPLDFNSNAIEVKAYTKWMLNFDSSFLYNKYINILSTATAKSEVKIIPQLHLFAEGGNLIEGLNTKIAFKATDQFGRPIEVSGDVMEDGKKVSQVTSVHDGMGAFYVQPQPGKKYSLRWKGPAGETHETKFPEVEKSGLLLRVTGTKENRVFFVQASGTDVAKSVRIIGTMFNQPVFNIQRDLTDGITQGSIPVNELPSGILTITVLNENYQPLAERITFVNNNEYSFTPQFEVEYWGMNKRARNEVIIEIPQHFEANLSISVTDAEIDFNDDNTIISELLLSSELKGKIHNPAFYFRNKEDSTANFLDLVMLTNGWRKISWTDIAAGKLPEIKFPLENEYNTVHGRIHGAMPNQLANAGSLIMIVNQKDEKEFIAAPIKPDGSFRAEDFILMDTATVYYQLPKDRIPPTSIVQFLGSQVPIAPGSNLPPAVPQPADTTGASRHLQFADEIAGLLKLEKAKVLETVTITAKTKPELEKMDEKYTTGMFSGGTATSFDLVNEKSASAYKDIFSYLQGRVAGVVITMTDPPTVTWRGGTPAFFLDEMPVDVQLLTTVPVTNIAYVKVINPPFLGAAGGGTNGAIAIYTRRGDDEKAAAPGVGLPKNTVIGYTMIRKFFSPDYLLGGDEDSRDVRTTLYWNPEVVMKDGQNRVKLTFYNNDISESFRIVIEGMTKSGQMAHVVKIME
ncbi:MAG: hypothetical protein J5I50_04945 [Chitinophagaceae bacterium]|nr:hypothetical protein [Chitinophagaceae bacterium]